MKQAAAGRPLGSKWGVPQGRRDKHSEDLPARFLLPQGRGSACASMGQLNRGRQKREKGCGRLRGARATREHLSETLEEPHPGHSPNPQASPLLWPPSSKWGQGRVVVGGHTWEVVKPG